MRDQALTLLACPSCRGDLELASTHRDPDGHVITGSLSCACGARYAIERGVPRLVGDDVAVAATRTSQRFGAEWKIFDHMASYQERWLLAWLWPLTADDFRGKTVFEGGCGKGRHTTVVASWGAKDVVALDLGDAVDVAFAHTRHLTNVHVVQGDLVRPPVKVHFDVGFSIGVLHHLPSPQAGFDALRGIVRTGGKLAVWVYGYESNEWIVRWVTPVRERVTARMPIAMLYWLSLAPAALVKAAAALHERLPYRDYLRQLAPLPLREIHSIVFDQLVTPIAFYLPRREVQRWFDDAKLTEITIGWHNRNSWRGCATIA